MSVGQIQRNSFRMVEPVERDEEGDYLWHGVKLVDFWKTEMQVAINESNRRKDVSFTICMGKSGISLPYQQPIPWDFVRYHKSLLQQSVTLEGPTGKTWTTVIRPCYRVVRFGKGWRQFSTENHLQEGHQLLFTLIGRFRFLVQFFDHLGKRCTSYPPLRISQTEPLLVSETPSQSDRQPDFQKVVDAGGQASHRHGNDAQASAAEPSIPSKRRSTTPSAGPLNSERDKSILRQCGPEAPTPDASLPHQHSRMPTFDPRNDSEDMKTGDEETESLEDESLYECPESGPESDDDDDLTYHPPKSHLVKPESKIQSWNEIFLREQAKFHSPNNQALCPQLQRHNIFSSSDDDLPFQYYPQMQKKVRKPATAKCRSPVAPPVAVSHEVGASSGRSQAGSPAMRLLQQQGCMRFSDMVSKCERRDVSDQERHSVVHAAKRFASKLGSEKFTVVMQDAQVYQGFHLAIPEKILQATGTEHASKVEVCLLDREQALYKAHWTRRSFGDSPLLDQDAWAKFAVDHSLQDGDVCVFQLLHSKPAFRFCVHIFRVVETPIDFSDQCNRHSTSARLITVFSLMFSW